MTINGFKRRDAIKMDIEGPNGALDDSKPAKMGMVEQEKKGAGP